MKTRQMKIRCALALSAACAAVVASAADYYVNPDPAKASDSYDGTAQVWDGTHGPRQTLKGAMTIKGLKSGDVVHAARGIYNEGVMAPISAWPETSNRVTMVAGVALVADEGRDVTVIEGFIPPLTPDSTLTNGGPTSVRCVAFPKSDKVGYVKGFTLRNGSTNVRSTDGKGEFGGAVMYGTVIDCLATNCYAVRAGAFANACCIRSIARNCGWVSGVTAAGMKASYNFATVMTCSLYDCLIEGNYYYGGKIVNSTITGKASSGTGGLPTPTYNSVIGEDGGVMAYTNCVLMSTLVSTSDADAFTRAHLNKTVSYDAFCRPLRASTVVDAGSTAESPDYPSAFEGEAGKDVWGRPRVTGSAIDVGCGEYAAYVRYADADAGDDGWSGFVATNATPETSLEGPCKTLAKAFEGLQSGDTVYALPGIYDEGGAVMGGVTNRVVVPTGAQLIGFGGPGVTFIKGAASSDASGYGSDSVRGAYVGAKGCLRGFTVRDGTTMAGKNGAGVYLDADAAVVNCRIVSNRAGGRSGVAGETSAGVIGCYVADNTSSDNTGNGGSACSFYNCVFEGDGGCVYTQEGTAVNCLFLGTSKFQGWKKTPYVTSIYNCVFAGSGVPSRAKVYRSLVRGAPTSVTALDGTQTNVTSGLTFDSATYRPLRRGNPAVDFADTNHYATNFPSQWSEFATVDYAGATRVVGDAIDAGARELDPSTLGGLIFLIK